MDSQDSSKVVLSIPQGQFYEPVKGYLHKRGAKGVVLTWKKRWFVLEQNVLSYYHDEKATTPLGQIKLHTVASIHPSSENILSYGEGIFWNTEGCYFQIDCPGRIYYLLADSKASMMQWVELLKASQKLYAELRYKKRTEKLKAKEANEDKETQQEGN